MSQDCIFCKIINDDISAEVVYRDDKVIVFNDLNPQAPTHCLVVPVEHIPTINDLQPEHNELLGHLFQTAKKIAADRGFHDDGYRVVMNCNRGGGQTVYHIHLHVLGGRKMIWPPG